MKYLFLLLLGNFLACSGENKNADSDLPPGKVRLKVDDKVIDRGNLDEIMLPLTWWVGVTDSEELYLQGLQRFSHDQRRVYAVLAYLKESTEQGHYQFFTSTNKLVRADALDALKMLNLTEHEAVLQHAIGKISTGKLEDVDFEDEDVNLLNLTDKANPKKIILDYIGTHRKNFYYEEIVTKP